MSIALFFQYMQMSDLTHRLIACKAHLEDVNRKCAKQSHCRKCKRVGDSLLSVLPGVTICFNSTIDKHTHVKPKRIKTKNI